MSASYRADYIRVRRLPSTVIRVGPMVTSAGGLGRLALPGSTLLFDPLTPQVAPTVEVSHAASADPTLRALFGDPVADAVNSADEAGTADPVDVPATFSPRLGELQRLGNLLWLSHAMPWPLPSEALTAELVTATAACMDLIEDPDVAAAALATMTDSVLHAVEGACAAAACPQTILDGLASAALAVAGQLPFADPSQAALVEAAERARRAEPTTSWRTRGADSLAHACTPGIPVHAGVNDAVLYSGSTTADATRNSPGLVSRDEDAVTWSVDTTGTSQAAITVVAAPAAAPPTIGDPPLHLPATSVIRALSDPLWPGPATLAACSFHTPAWPLALVDVVLTPFPGTGNLTGTATLTGATAQALTSALHDGSLIADAHDAGHRFAHLRRPDPTVEAARRWTVRAVCATRLALASTRPDVKTAALSAWTRALTLWEYTRASTGGPALAQERIRHCTAWRDLLTGTPSPAPTGSRDVADPVDAQDVDRIIDSVTGAEALTAPGP